MAAIIKPKVKERKVISGKDGTVALSDSMREKLIIFDDGTAMINENCLRDVDVINKVAILSHTRNNKGLYIIVTDKIEYVSPNVIYAKYAGNTQAKFADTATEIQLEIAELVRVASRKRATDVHIVVETTATFIYFRILGDLETHQTLTSDHGVLLCNTLYNTMTTTSGTNFNPRTQQDANIQESFLPSELSGIRVASSPTQGGNFFMVLRLLPKGVNVTLTDLGYAAHQLKKLDTFKSKHNGGMTICAGPTGSGKSTLLQALTKSILLAHKGRINLITIEDPVEYPIIVEDIINDKKINYSARQVSIPSTQDRTLRHEYFYNAIVAAMRQDPDIIMIGEIRDLITAEAAITASITGHAILTTLHANNAIMIIDRLLNMGASKAILLAPKTITGLIAQQLVPLMCPNCKLKLVDHLNQVDEALIERLKKAFNNDLDGIYIKGNGCDYIDKVKKFKCINGIYSRCVIAEIVEPDNGFLLQVMESNIFSVYNYWIEEQKGITMMCHGLVKVKFGILDPRDLENILELIKPQANFDIALSDN